MLAEALPCILFVIIPIPLAISSTQILAVDLGFELLLTLSLGWEPAEDPEKILSTSPRRVINSETVIKNHQLYLEKKDKTLVASNTMLNKIPEGLSDSAYLLNTTMDDDYNLDQAEELPTINQTQQRRYKAKARKYLDELRLFFSDKHYWQSFWNSLREIFISATDEKLVDSRVLLWSYIEGGIIELSGALFTFFAVLWIEFGIDPTTARRGQLIGGLYWKPQSPDLINGEGIAIVCYFLGSAISYL